MKNKTEKMLYCLVAIILILSINISLMYHNFRQVNAWEAPEEPFFKLVFMSYEASPVYMAMSGILANEFSKIGIDAKVIAVDVTSLITRAWGSGVDMPWRGKTYDDGGWDVMINTLEGGDPINTHYWDMASTTWVPAGSNWCLINNSILDEAFTKINTDPTLTEEDILYQYEIINTEMSEDKVHIVFLVTKPFVYYTNPDLENFPKLNWFPRDLDEVTVQGKTTADHVILRQCQLADPTSLVMNFLGVGGGGPAVIFDSLIDFDENGKEIPELATGYEVSEDGKTWTIHLREDVKWHDGVTFNATDVWWTWTTVMNATYNSKNSGTMMDIFGDPANIEIVDEYTIKCNLPEFNRVLLSMMHRHDQTIEPWHVLKDMSPEEMGEHTYNTGIGSYEIDIGNGETYTAYGPIGTGPYKYMGFDPVLRSQHLVKFEDSWRIPLTGEPIVDEFYSITISELDSAIAALKNGDIDVVGSPAGYTIAPKLGEVEGQPWCKVRSNYSTYFLQLSVNNQHPTIGTGVETPLGMSDPTKAAEAAAYVRRALSCATPRDAMCQQIYNGLTKPQYSVRHVQAQGFPGVDYTPHSYNLTKAKEWMEMAGYVYPEEEEPDPIVTDVIPGWVYPTIGLLGIAVVAVGAVAYRTSRSKQTFSKRT